MIQSGVFPWTARSCHASPTPRERPACAPLGWIRRLHPSIITTAEVRAADELYTGDLRHSVTLSSTPAREFRVDEPPFAQAASRYCAENTCCNLYVSDAYWKCFIWMLQKYGWCCMYCDDYTRMLQVYVSYVSTIFRHSMLDVYVSNVLVILDVCCSVSSECCKSISECYICSNDYTDMFQAYIAYDAVSNVYCICYNNYTNMF
jgi:hypothetical protein